MIKWICKECGENTPCVLEFGEYVNPKYCPIDKTIQDWQEVKKETLPKLTTEVFDRPDCPEWAKYAVVDVQGLAYWYQYSPLADERIGDWKAWGNKRQLIDGFFDRSDWQNSLIERPARLPDWCKVGEWVYDKAINKYSQVATEDVTEGLQEVRKIISKGEIVQARLRPYNSEEMKALVGNTIEYDSHVCLVIGYNGNKNTIFIANGSELCVQTLMSYYNVNGKPAGVFEHLENGEWVE